MELILPRQGQAKGSKLGTLRLGQQPPLNIVLRYEFSRMKAEEFVCFKKKKKNESGDQVTEIKGLLTFMTKDIVWSILFKLKGDRSKGVI